jgi:hypothetical protein
MADKKYPSIKETANALLIASTGNDGKLNPNTLRNNIVAAAEAFVHVGRPIDTSVPPKNSKQYWMDQLNLTARTLLEAPGTATTLAAGLVQTAFKITAEPHHGLTCNFKPGVNFADLRNVTLKGNSDCRKATTVAARN